MKHDGLAHLLPAAREQAQLGSEDRVKGLLRDRWIDYSRATEALQVLQRLFETPHATVCHASCCTAIRILGRPRLRRSSGALIPMNLTSDEV